MVRLVFGILFLILFSMELIPVRALAQRRDPKNLDELVDHIENPEIKFESSFRQASSKELGVWPSQVWVDPDFDFVRITKEPGKTWLDCSRNSSLCLGWPDGQSKLERVKDEPILERDELNVSTGEVETVQYMKVRFEYSRVFTKKDGSQGILDQKGEGWIDTRVLRKEKLQPIYKEEQPVPAAQPVARPKPRGAQSKPPKPCPPKTRAQANHQDLKDVAKVALQTPHEQLNVATDLLKPLVGKCPLQPPTTKRLDRWKNKNIYDTEALPLINAQQKDFPKVPKLGKDGATIEVATKHDLIAVDTLARTLYSEMNECFQSGLQFPLAAAKVAMNRTELVDAGKAPRHFAGPPQAADKPTISKVLTSPFQFSVWNYIGASNPKDKTVLMSLCPTRDDSKQNWKGTKGTPQDQAAWDFAVKIATEAVLFSQRFQARTKQVAQLYYTSKRNEYDGRQKASPQIEGRPVDSFRCMYLWNGK